MRAKLVFLVVLLVIPAMIVSASAVAATRARTTVTIVGPQGDFEGEIHSDSKACLGGRKVKVYKQSGKERSPADDMVIASDTSERQGAIGVWSVGNTGFKSGRFYAKVSKTAECRAAFSPTIKL